VSKELSAALGPQAALATVPVGRKSSSLRASRTVGIVLAGSAFVAACAHVALPLYFTPVPLSMAPFAVLLLGLLLSPRLAAATLGTYLAEGAMGLPVFAPIPLAAGSLAHLGLAHLGLAHLAGPTGGYLLAYPLAAALMAFLVRRTDRGFASAMLSAAVGSLVILFCGGLWLAVLTHASAQSVFTLAILPFLPGDALKVAAAAGLASGWVRLRRRAA
jgi:biotin transport system substrate-specific component